MKMIFADIGFIYLQLKTEIFKEGKNPQSIYYNSEDFD